MPSHQLRKHTLVALLIGIVGWLVPGSGHMLLRQWGRGVGVFVTVGALAAIAMAVRGRLFLLATNDFFDLLGFAADCGAGVFFYLAQKWSNGGADVAHAAGDYGTRFFAAAGVLNVLAAVDAYRIARGQEEDDDEEESDATTASEVQLDPNSAASALPAQPQTEIASEADNTSQQEPPAGGDATRTTTDS